MRPPTSLHAAAALALSLMLALGIPSCARSSEPELPAVGASLEQTTVSGLSSGAYMAGQFQFAHSEIVTGAAIIAGGPYGCAESTLSEVIPRTAAAGINAVQAINVCMKNQMAAWGLPDIGRLAERARGLAAEGRIGPIADVMTDRIYVFSGRNDTTVHPAIVAAAAELYGRLGVPAHRIRAVHHIPAGHAFVTEDQGAPCDHSEPPHIVDCDFDLAGDLLQHLLGPLAPPADKSSGETIVFDQRPFIRDLVGHGMADSGVAYIPSACRQSRGCRPHVVFHGCGQSRDRIGDRFITQTGYIRWSETNRLVLLFPQIGRHDANPRGCWDWWGYTGSSFLTRQAPQIEAVRRMLEQLSG